MNKRRIKYIIGLVGFALIGIVIVQLLWINNAISENEKRFNARVYAMLNRVVQKTERNELALMYRYNPGIVRQSFRTTRDSLSPEADSAFKKMQQRSIEQLRKLSKSSPFGKDLNRMLKQFDSMKQLMQKRMQGKRKQIHSVYSWLTFEAEVKQLPLKRRLQLSQLERILYTEKKNFNITIPMEYAVVSSDKKPPALQSKNFQKKSSEYNYKAEIFPNDVLGDSPELILQFQDKNRFLIHSIQWLLLLSLLFTIIVLLAFYMTIRTILQQKKVSEVKNDFINNMTHELKTPIATITLAIDAMSRNINESASGFTKIIKQESDRMHKQVEHILQMARIDKNQFRLNTENLELNEFVRNVCVNQQLRVKEKNGSLHFEAAEKPLQVSIDPDHFANVIYNLVDNALKYTENAPNINLKAQKNNGKAQLTVTDNGLGMNKETLRHIFDKFYRAASGNVHDVKGFGLGLSYVKAVMEKHQGTISVKSEPGEGSEFILQIPVCEEN